MVFIFMLLNALDHKLKFLWEGKQVRGVLVYDSNNDNKDELYVMSGFDGLGSTLIKESQEGKWYYRVWYPGDVGFPVSVFDSDGDDVEEIFTKKTEKDSAFIYILSPDGKIKYRKFISTGKDRDGDKKWAGYVDGVLPFDYNNDGISEILCIYDVGTDVYPRGIMLIDGKSFNKIWDVKLSTSIKTEQDIYCSDIDGDGRKEIVVGGFSYNSGNKTNFSDDAHTFVYVISNEGKLIWKWRGREGMGKSVVKVGNVLGDGRKEIVVIDKSFSEERELPDTMYIFDSKGNVLRKRAFSLTFSTSIELCDLNFDGKEEIIAGVIGDEKRQLLIIDSSLNIIKTGKVFRGNKGVEPVSLVDLNGDGINEIIAIGGSSAGISINPEKVIIFDKDIKPKAKVDFAGTAILKLRNFNKYRLILIEGTEFSIYDYELSYTNFLFNFQNPVVIAVVMFFVFILGLTTGGLYFNNRRKKFQKNLDTLNIGFGILNEKRKLIYSNSMFNNVITEKEFNKIIDELGDRNELKSKIEKDGKIFYLSIFKKNKNIVMIVSEEPYREYAERILKWAELSRHFTHSLKNQVWAISLSIEEIEASIRGKKAKENLKDVKESMDKIVSLASSLSSFSKLPEPVLRRGNLNEFLKKLIRKYEEKFAEVKFIFKPTSLPPVNFDPVLTEVVFENIIKNSIESMNKEKIIFIVTLTEEEINPETKEIEKYVAVVIQDTGKGIPERVLKKIGTPYFTTKKTGTGLGIYIVKQLLKEQNGKFYIESEKGKGTKVTIKFKI